MSKIDRLLELTGKKAGAKKELAAICGVDPSMVTRWLAGGVLPAKYNSAVRHWAAFDKRKTFETPEEWEAFYLDVRSCLDPDVCPTCGQPIHDEGRKV